MLNWCSIIPPSSGVIVSLSLCLPMSQINKTQPCECVHRSHEDKPKEGGGEVALFSKKFVAKQYTIHERSGKARRGRPMAAPFFWKDGGINAVIVELMVDSVGEVVGLMMGVGDGGGRGFSGEVLRSRSSRRLRAWTRSPGRREPGRAGSSCCAWAGRRSSRTGCTR